MKHNPQAKLFPHFAKLIIAYQDDVTFEEASEFYELFDDALHQNCPANNQRRCPKCRVSSADDLAGQLIMRIHELGYEIKEKEND